MTRWPEDDDWLLTQCYATLSTRDLAAALGKSLVAVKCRANRLGLHRPGRRPWTAAEVRLGGARYHKSGPARVAALLGRPVGQIHQAADRYGVMRRRPEFTPAREAELRRLHAAGLTDAAAARAMGVDRKYVQVRRVDLGLPVNAAAVLAARRRGLQSQREALGIRDGGGLRALGYRNYAIHNGWPADLRPREVQILNALAAAGVPLTRPRLAEIIGMPAGPHRSGRRRILLGGTRDRGGTYTATLVRRGLLVRLPRLATVTGKGRSLDLYALSPAALAILADRARRQQAGVTP